MKYVQINSFYNGSTGTIMRRLHAELEKDGHDSYIFWGRRHETISDHEQCFATKLGVYAHGACARLTDRLGFYSKSDTRRLLAKLDEIDPDIVHLHNLHGYYINIEMLFDWLARREQRTYWTLHDCWSFTGHCAHFTYVGCGKWKQGCASCPQTREYPASLLSDNSARNYADKQRIFTMLPADKLTIITPCNWLAGLVKRSFLSHYPVEVRPNEVNRAVFKPTASNFKGQHGIDGRFLILGVSDLWTKRKGIDDFVALANALDERFALAIVGLDVKQIASFRNNLNGNAHTGETALQLAWAQERFERKADEMHIDATGANASAQPTGTNGCAVILLTRTDTQAELAQIYSAADVFFNPTREDTFPTVNLEAEACGTPVVTYNLCGCKETIHLPESCAIEVV